MLFQLLLFFATGFLGRPGKDSFLVFFSSRFYSNIFCTFIAFNLYQGTISAKNVLISCPFVCFAGLCKYYWPDLHEKNEKVVV